MQRLADALKAAMLRRRPPTLQSIADGLRARQAAGEALTERQREFIALDDAGPQHGGISGAGMAIPDNLLPPGMRGDGIAREFAAELIARADAGEWVAPDRLDAAHSLVKRGARRPAAAPSHEMETA